MSLDTLLSQLEKLEAAATKGPWWTSSDAVAYDSILSYDEIRESGARRVCYSGCSTDRRRATKNPQHLGNLEFIAATRNATPILIAAIKEMKSALEKIGCNETFHRLGGIDDCIRCLALEKVEWMVK